MLAHIACRLDVVHKMCFEQKHYFQNKLPQLKRIALASVYFWWNSSKHKSLDSWSNGRLLKTVSEYEIFYEIMLCCTWFHSILLPIFVNKLCMTQQPVEENYIEFNKSWNISRCNHKCKSIGNWNCSNAIIKSLVSLWTT